MTEAQVIELIESSIATNSNNEIKADVLRPVLVSMTNQINALVGSLANLSTSNTLSIVNAINSLTDMQGGVVVRSGTANPNVTAPPVVNQGDFYNRMFSGNTIEYYVYTGLEFVLLVSMNREIEYQPNSFDIRKGMDTIIYNGNATGIVYGLPDVGQNNQRQITIVNQSEVTLNTNVAYIGFSGQNVTTVGAGTSVTLKCNGLNWIRKI